MDRKRGPRLERWLSRIPKAASATSILGALIVLSGWMFRIPILRSFFPEQPPMRPNAALCLVLVGASLWLLHEEGIPSARRFRRRLAGRLFAAAATVIGLLSLSEFLLGVDLGTDRLVFQNFTAGIGGAHPLRIPPASALGIVLMGCALLSLGRSTRGGHHPSEFLAGIAILDGVFGTLDYLLNPAVHSTGMALNASLLFMIFGCGLFSVCAQHRLRALLTSQGLAATAVRHLFPAAVILPVLIGWVAWRGQKAGFYGSDEGLALTVVVSVAVLALVVVWTAEHLQHTEAEIRKLNEELEQRVIDRTAQLEAANTQLREEITERQRSEEALRASEERFRVLSEAMPQIVWSADATGGVDYYNQRAFEYGGVQPTDIHGWNWASIIHPDDLEATLSNWRRALVNGETSVIEHRLRRADGQFRWHLTRGVPVRDREGQVVRWIGTATDIHEKKLAEEELERRVAERTAALAKSMSLLETVTSNAPVILFATDARGVFTLHTGKAITATGRQAGEIIGKNYREVLSDTPGYQDNFRRVLDGEEFTAVIEGAKGSVFETLYTPLRDAEGKIAGMIGLSLDITARKRAEQELRRLNRALRTLSECNQAVVRARDESELLQNVCRILV